MIRKVLLLFCWVVGSHYQLHAQSPVQPKYALVIGVKTYQHVPPLANSLNDARDMSSVLKKKGFKVIELYDPPSKRIMQDAVKRYFDLLRNEPQAAGLVYYSGHGMQVKGVNYLVPTQADPQMEADLEDQCVKLDYLMTALQEAGNSLNIFILDACRNNPFRGFTRSGEKGLSMVDAPKGSYIVYATKPGSVASDGTGRNGLFTSKLLQHMNTSGLNIEQVFKQVAKDVATASNDQQRPWIASDYTGDFYFTPGTVSVEKPVVATGEKMVSDPVAATGRGAIKKSLPDDLIDFGYGAGTTPVVTIGSQSWAGSNLNVDRFSNGDVIPEARGEAEWNFAGKNGMPAWCHYLNKTNNGERYGKLYNFYAVTDKRAICPAGWHVPSEEEWGLLASQFTGNAGAKLKSTDGWLDGVKGTNESGFNGLAAGYRFYYDGSFKGDGATAVWWSSTEDATGSVSGHSLFHKVGFLDAATYNKKAGMSVRCLKN